MKTSYQLEGMTCAHCEKAVKEALSTLSDTLNVEVDLKSNIITIDGFDDHNRIKDAVEEAGFDFIRKL